VTFIKLLLLILLISLFVYGLAVLLPKKLALVKKYGADKSNQDLIALAKQGNEDLAQFYKQSKIYLLLLLSCSGVLSVLHQLTKG
jgi:hypothetical protein